MTLLMIDRFQVNDIVIAISVDDTFLVKRKKYRVGGISSEGYLFITEIIGADPFLAAAYYSRTRFKLFKKEKNDWIKEGF